jgi:glucose-1-phosphate adenylyltransferase
LSYQYEGYWTDIGNIDSFFEANIGLTEDLPKFNLFDNDNKILPDLDYSAIKILKNNS